MSYRKTSKYRQQLAAMRAAKEALRMAGPRPDYPPALPDLRRRLIVIDYDFGERIHTLDMYRTDRADCYRVVADGVEWKSRIGWSRILAGLRKSMPRVAAV